MQIGANRPIIATECHRLKKGDRIVNSRSGAGRSFFLFIYIVEPKWKDHHVGGVFYGLIVEQFYGVGFEEIVTVEVLYIFALCGFYSRFTGVGKSFVGFVDDDDARVFVGISGDDFRRVVCTAVVDDNDFYVGECLGDDRVETFFELFTDVVDGYDDRYFGWQYLIFFLQI